MGVAVTVGATFTTTMMAADVPEAMLESLQLIGVVVVQDQPTGADTETYVVLVGIASVKTTFAAEAGPLFVMVWV
jgi:hypothetical protein